MSENKEVKDEITEYEEEKKEPEYNVSIFRNTGVVGCIAKVVIFCDGIEIARIGNYKYANLMLSEGTHKLKARYSTNIASSDSLVIDVKDDQKEPIRLELKSSSFAKASVKIVYQAKFR